MAAMRRLFSPATLALAAAAAVVPACSSQTAPAGLRPTPAGDGPTIVFDVARRPLPEIPTPNDIATFADPTSRTGRRINVSLVAPTHLERSAREGFAELEGWGTFAPISVRFSRDAQTPETQAAIDLEAVRARMQHDDHDMTDDPVYVVNLTTGLPVMLDMGDGNFPATARDLDKYYENDPRSAEHNILFESAEEGAGLGASAYRPSLDTDFDGVLDHPNTLPSRRPGAIAGVDDLMTWYERETDTLVMRPLLPMDEKTEYAVVITDRLRSASGSPARSPFPFIHHPAQRTPVARLATIFADASRRNYYGDVAGSGLDHVAFAWSFTTAPVAEDLRLLRDGLHGVGPFSAMASRYPTTTTPFRLAGLARDVVDDPPNWQANPKCKAAAARPYVVQYDQLAPSLELLVQALSGFGVSQPEVDAVKQSLTYVDHFVIGTFPVSYLMGDPDHEDPDARFALNYKTGEGRFGTDTSHFILAVPKASAAAKQPFDTVVWSHGTAQSDIEIMIRAGYFARQGMATFGFDAPGHGLYIGRGTETLLQGVLEGACLVPVAKALTTGRARDINHDGTPDPGGLLWTSHIFHSRDNIRQTVLDAMQATRVVRSFDGRTGSLDTDGDGVANAEGDFDGDGTPDVGGPKARIFSAGDSYGGIVAQIHSALDPEVLAGASISGAGGLTDVAARSYGVVDSVVEQLLTPLVVAVPASARPPSADGKETNCAAGQRSVRMVVNDLIRSAEVELACLPEAELTGNMTVVLTNLTTREVRCARTSSEGRFRVPIPSNVGDRLDVQLYDGADAVTSYESCALALGARAGRSVRTFEQPRPRPRPVADADVVCEGEAGCAQFRDLLIPVGSALFAVQEGLGLRRQTPELRKLFALTQSALDGADPVNFAPLFMLRDSTGYGGAPAGPKAFMDANTSGDAFVVVGAGAVFARAMGALPFLPPRALTDMPEFADYATPSALYDALGGRTPNDVMIDNFAIEGNFRLARTPAGATCAANYVASAACSAPPATNPTICADTVADIDWLAEGNDRYDAVHPPVPLRLARLARLRARDAASLSASWKPRLAGAPFSNDGGFSGAEGPVVSLVNAYVNPLGQHVWVTSNPCKAWDDALYYDHVVGRFFASGGQDVYFLSHPKSHACLATEACDFFK